MPTELQKKTYEDIMSLYDSTEEVINIAEKIGTDLDPISEEVENLVDNLQVNIDALMDNFLQYIESGRTLSGVTKLKMEKAQKEINDSINNFLNHKN